VLSCPAEQHFRRSVDLAEGPYRELLTSGDGRTALT
jgi:hypothetical protein